MLKFITLSLTITLILSCQNGESGHKALNGKEIFKQNCVLCHGIKGDLMTNGAKNLTLSDLTLEERILVISKGRNIMTGFEEKLSPIEIQTVAEFTLSLKEK
ncbi:MAG: c-type cytochrome [Saprospiraceae bacterium]